MFCETPVKSGVSNLGVLSLSNDILKAHDRVPIAIGMKAVA